MILQLETSVKSVIWLATGLKVLRSSISKNFNTIRYSVSECSEITVKKEFDDLTIERFTNTMRL